MEETKGLMKEIYSIDMFHTLPLEEEQKPEDDIPNGRFIRHMDFEGQDIQEIMDKGSKYVYELDHDFLCIKRQRKPDFYEFYQKALENYIDGDWVNAQSNLNNCAMMMPNDGPMLWMSEFLEKQKNLAPEGWAGYRDLNHKQPVQEIGITKTEEFGTMDQDANPEIPSGTLSPKSPTSTEQ